MMTGADDIGNVDNKRKRVLKMMKIMEKDTGVEQFDEKTAKRLQ